MTAQTHDRNSFLTALSAPEYDLLRPHLTAVELRAGERLYRLGDRVDNVVFAYSGMVAMTGANGEQPGAGVTIIGRDGIIGGFAAAGGVPATCNADVHIAGHAVRMPASAYRHVLDRNTTIRRVAARFEAATIAQTQQTALCNASHSVEARICRWLLEIQDRCGGSNIPLTQSTLAEMLGVRRTTVTLLAGKLETAGVLNCRRGYLQILSRADLERHSCQCYGHMKGYVTRLFATPIEDAAMADPKMAS
jgi:CRP-like cAMP-binding protein